MVLVRTGTSHSLVKRRRGMSININSKRTGLGCPGWGILAGRLVPTRHGFCSPFCFYVSLVYDTGSGAIVCISSHRNARCRFGSNDILACGRQEIHNSPSQLGKYLNSKCSAYYNYYTRDNRSSRCSSCVNSLHALEPCRVPSRLVRHVTHAGRC
jgi:hypothetical protein